MRKGTSFILLICAMILLQGCSSVIGTSVWKEDIEDFQTGETSKTKLGLSEVLLAKNNTVPAEWAVTYDGIPGTRFDNGFVFDPVNKVSVLFGGSSDNLTWTYDAAKHLWKNMRPATAPGPRTLSPMAYDAKNGVMVIYGGYNSAGTTFYNDTWTYNVTTNTWMNKAPTSTPLAMYAHCLAYDMVSGAVVLFGGEDSSYGTYNETWHYYVTNNTWINVTGTTTGFPPKQALGFGMAYDEANKVMIMYTTTGQTWAYNPAASSWKIVLTVSTTPGSIARFGFCYDKDDLVMLLHGAWNVMGPNTNETWTFNYLTSTWTKLTPSTLPPQHGIGQMVYEPNIKTLLVFGGFIPSGPVGYYVSDMWWLNFTQNKWTYKEYNSPVFRRGYGLVYEPTNDVTMLFGGYTTGLGGMLFNDTWFYNHTNKNWTNVSPVTSPPPRYGHAMIYDPGTGNVVVFGGAATTSTNQNDTWVFSPSSKTWTNVTNSVAPPPMKLMSFAFDIDTKKMVLFGGNDVSVYYNQTWTFAPTTNTWANVTSGNEPSIRYQTGMAYDQSNKQMILYGGYVPSVRINETWSYNVSNNSWTQLFPSVNPNFRNGHTLTYDTTYKVIVLYGGIMATTATGGTTQMNDTWIYDPIDNIWSQIPTPNAPAPMSLSYLAYNPKERSYGTFTGSNAEFWKMTNLSVSYEPGGNYSSNIFDAGGQAYFGTIEWNATNTPNTAVKLQFRSGNSSLEVQGKTFLGPDGTAGTYYTNPSTTINGVHNNSRWFQYTAYLSTTNLTQTPKLRDVTVKYNLVHDLFLNSPLGGENWTDSHNITWSANDPDLDTLTFDINLVNISGQRTPLAVGLPNVTTKWEWNTTPVANGTYQIEVVAKDNGVAIPLTVNKTTPSFVIFHPKPPNQAPKAYLVAPNDNMTVNTTNMTLSWYGEDYNGDNLSYYVLLTKTAINLANLPRAAALTNGTSYDATGLANGTTYYWTVIPNDGTVNGTPNSVRKFDVILPPPNHAPAVALASPANNSVVTTANITLTWQGVDTDGDTLTYYVIIADAPFDRNSPPPRVAETGDSSHDIWDLESGATYFWTVIANDGQVNGTTPALRSFRVELDNPPTVTLTSPQDGSTVDVVNPALAWTFLDEDGDNVTFDVYLSDTRAAVDGHELGVRLVPGIEETTFGITSDLDKGRTYYWTVIPYDGKVTGECGSGTWSFKISENAGKNNPPKFTTLPELVIGVGQEWSYTPVALDADIADNVDISLVSGPTGMTFTTGTLEWTPTSNHIGTHEVVVQATDGKAPVFQRFNITVTPEPVINHVPLVTPIAAKFLDVGEPLSVQISATDEDGDILSYRIVDAPEGVSVDGTGLITWKPTDADEGTHQIRINVSDGSLGAETSFDVTVGNGAGKGGATTSFPWWILLVIMAVVVVLGTVIYMSKKKKGKQEGQNAVEAQVAAASVSATPTPLPPPPQPQPAFSQPGPQPYSLYPFPEPTQGQPQPAIAFRPVPVMHTVVTEPVPAASGPEPVVRTMDVEVQAPVEEHRPPAFEVPAAKPPETGTVAAAETGTVAEVPAASTPNEQAWEALNGAVEAIEAAKAGGKDTKRAESMLRLARTFFAKDDFKKAMDYANKAKNMV